MYTEKQKMLAIHYTHSLRCKTFAEAFNFYRVNSNWRKASDFQMMRNDTMYSTLYQLACEENTNV